MQKIHYNMVFTLLCYKEQLRKNVGTQNNNLVDKWITKKKDIGKQPLC